MLNKKWSPNGLLRRRPAQNLSNVLANSHILSLGFLFIFQNLSNVLANSHILGLGFLFASQNLSNVLANSYIPGLGFLLISQNLASVLANSTILGLGFLFISQNLSNVFANSYILGLEFLFMFQNSPNVLANSYILGLGLLLIFQNLASALANSTILGLGFLFRFQNLSNVFANSCILGLGFLFMFQNSLSAFPAPFWWHTDLCCGVNKLFVFWFNFDRGSLGALMAGPYRRLALLDLPMSHIGWPLSQIRLLETSRQQLGTTPDCCGILLSSISSSFLASKEAPPQTLLRGWRMPFREQMRKRWHLVAAARAVVHLQALLRQWHPKVDAPCVQ